MSQEFFEDVSHDETAGLESTENLLRRLQLRAPSDALDARVLPMLARVPPGGRARAFLMGLAAMAAVCAGVSPVLYQRHEPRAMPTKADNPNPSVPGISHAKPPVPEPRRFASSKPFALEHTVTRIADGGVVNPAGGLPMQCYRRQSLRQVVLVDPKRGTRVAVTIPTDEVVLRPIHPF
ncbi:MAG: hypothetical protein JWM97_2115 [Phycisphaerales bacterium]|nr:hypothetical protein [Phycisphaerales bacterium]